jgi:Ca2+/H+ antiporter
MKAVNIVFGLAGLALSLTKLHQYFNSTALYVTEVILSLCSLIILYLTWAFHCDMIEINETNEDKKHM